MGLAAEQPFHEGLAVDRQADCPADPCIPEWISVHLGAVGIRDAGGHVPCGVHVDIDDPERIALGQGQLRRCGDTGPIRGRHALDHVHVAGQDGRHPGAVIRDRADRHVLPRLHAAPIGRVALQLQLVARHPFDELVRAGADGGAAVVEIRGGFALGRVPRKDRDRIQVHQQGRRRALGVDADRVGIDHFHAVDRLGVLRIGGWRVRHVRRPRQGERHVIGGEGRAVVECHAVAQVEFPHIVADHLPRFRKPRLDLAAPARPHQRVEDVPGDGPVRHIDVVMRIDRIGVGADRDRDIRSGGRHGQRRGESKCDQRRTDPP